MNRDEFLPRLARDAYDCAVETGAGEGERAASAANDDACAARSRCVLRRAMRAAPRVLAALAAAAAGVWLARDRLAEIDADAFWPALAAASPVLLTVAALCGLLSHLAVAAYDLPALARVGRKLPSTDALRGGFAAGAMAQSLGLGPLTGALARWRMHRAAGLGAGEAAAVTGFVCLGFYAGLLCLLVPAVVILPGPAADALGMGAGDLRALALLLAAGLAVGAGLLARAPKLAFGRVKLSAPGGRWLLGSALLTAADLIPAAAALWLLLPHAPAFGEFALVYAAAIGLGLATGAPGGVGVFEAVMLGAFPHVPAAEMAAALLLYRAVYHGPALLIALRMLARSPRAAQAECPSALRDALEWAAEDAERAEVELAFAGDKHILFDETGRAFVMYGVRGRWRVMMGDPHGPRELWGPLMDAMEAAAKAEGRRVAVYKAEAGAADFWRARGMHLQPLGEEALIDPQSFSIEGPERRELRRKIAKVTKAGLEIAVHAPGDGPMEEMETVAAAWEAAKPGTERRFSMGAWDRSWAARHHVVTARIKGELVAFLTLWRAGRGDEWSIDLMRQLPDAPDGAMHALIAEGVAASGRDGAARFNLCMAPLSGLDAVENPSRATRALEAFYTRTAAGRGLQGLRRFKQIFRPEWSARHLVTPSARHVPSALLASALLVRGAAQSAPPPRIAGRPAPMPVSVAPSVAQARAAGGAVILPFRRKAAERLGKVRDRAEKLRRRA